MNIKELLITSNLDGVFVENLGIDNQERSIIKNILSDFLTCNNDRKRETLAFVLMNRYLRPNQKQRVAGMMEIMNMFELFERYELEEINRKHLVHQVNTFLLGLLFYKTNNKIKINIDQWITQESEETHFQLRNNITNEFYFRWKLAAFTHDLGNGISLFGNNKQKINKYITYLESVADFGYLDNGYKIESLFSLWRDRNTFDLFSSIRNSIDLFGFWNKLLSETGHKIIKNYYDHGIVSALIIIKYIDQMYFLMENLQKSMNNQDIRRQREYFDFSIVPTMYAVAIHNLDFYPKKDHDEWESLHFTYNFKSQPFCWLLKISDMLQEWDKTKAKDENNSVDADEIEYEITTENIIIKNFPDAVGLKDTIENYFETEEIIQIDNNLL